MQGLLEQTAPVLPVGPVVSSVGTKDYYSRRRTHRVHSSAAETKGRGKQERVWDAGGFL